MTRKPIMTKEEVFRKSVDDYIYSEKTAEDLFELMVKFGYVTRPNAGLSYVKILEILKEEIN